MSNFNFKYQFIIININDERKQNMIEIMKQLNIVNYKFIDANNPSNTNFIPSEEFLQSLNFNISELSETEKRQKYCEFCCIKSHFDALLYCYYNSPYEYNIILEDDVAPLKENFINIINELIFMWELNKNNIIELFQIGWIPSENYSNYIYKDTIYKDTKYDFKFLQFYSMGTQGYITSKRIIHKYLDILKSENYEILLTKLINSDKIKKINYDGEYNRIKYIEIPICIDWILNRLFLIDIVVFPPLLIEQNISSIIGNKNIEKYWKPFFKNNENIQNKYITY